jgi:hypothetical protein
MTLTQFIKQTLRNSYVSLVMGVVAFVLVLVITLDLSAAGMVLMLFVAVAVFQNSFYRGWLFLLFSILLFSSLRIGLEGKLVMYEIILIVTALVGLVNISVESVKLSKNYLSKYFFLFLVCAGGVIGLGTFSGREVSPQVWQLGFYLAMFWLLLVTFQYFFQTLRRLEGFFLVIVVAGVLHSLVGLVAFFSGWQSSSGMGVTSGKAQHLIFGSFQYKVSGFFGDGAIFRIGESTLAPFLLISIPVTLGFLLNVKYRRKRNTLELAATSAEVLGLAPGESEKSPAQLTELHGKNFALEAYPKIVPEIEEGKKSSDSNQEEPKIKIDLKSKLIDSAQNKEKYSARFYWTNKFKELQKSLVKIKKELKKKAPLAEDASEKELQQLLNEEEEPTSEEIIGKFLLKSLLLLLLLLQMLALTLTFSYYALIILAVGMFMAGILLRNNFIVLTTAVTVIAVAIVFPGVKSSFLWENSGEQWLSGFQEIKNDPILGNGWLIEKEKQQSSAGEIYNSYFYIWNTLGISGLIILLLMLFRYFKDIYDLYKKSDGIKRIWLVVSLAVFAEFALLGLSTNALLFGPAALAFWLFYGAVLNLKAGQMVKGKDQVKLYY